MIGVTRKLLNKYEMVNCNLILDFVFPKNHKDYIMDKDLFDDDTIDNTSCLIPAKLDYITMKFEELFVNPQNRWKLRQKLQKHHLVVYTIDFTKPPSQRFNHLKPKYIGLKSKDIGININYQQEYIKIFYQTTTATKKEEKNAS